MRAPAVAKKKGRPAKPSGQTKGRLVITCNSEYEKWVGDLADHLRTTTSGAIDRVLAEWAEFKEYPPPPPRI
jgi:hypothetical protein